MAALLRRLARALGGTACFAVAPLFVLFIPHIMAEAAPWVVLLLWILKLLVASLFLAKGVQLYTQASFPGGEEALEDPATNWMFLKLQQLKERSVVLWFIALLVLSFTPFLTMVCLPLILARPFYVTAVTPGATPAMLWAEIKRTARFLFNSAKGLFFLLLCTLMGTGAALLSLSVFLYTHWPQTGP